MGNHKGGEVRKLSKALVKAIPYAERLRRFHAEKNHLLQSDPTKTAAEMEEVTKRLAKKWQV